MAQDAQKRAVLDQITDEATTPQPLPGPLSPIVGQSAQPLPATGPTPTLPYAPTTATVDDSTNELEKEKSSPDEMAARETAAKEENPPTFLDKLKKFATPGNIARTAGGVGDALALAAGTPEERQIAEEDEQMPLKLAQIANEREWRQGMLAINQQKANTGDQNADTKSKVANNATIPLAGARLENLGANTAKTEYETEVMKQGAFPVDPVTAQLVNRPDLAGKPVPAALWKGLNSVLQARGLHTADLGAEGLWILDRAGNRIHQVSSVSPSMARNEAYMLRAQEAGLKPVNDELGNLTGWVNPVTGKSYAVSDVPGAENLVGGATGGSGAAVIPPKPTGNVMTRGQVAQTILPQIPVIQNEISAASGRIGPGEGRWNEWWVNKGGMKDPDFAGLSQDLQLYATAVAMAHFGASAPQSYVEALMNDFGTAQSPENLAAKVDHAGTWIEGYAARVGGNPNAHKNPPSNNGTPQVQSFKDWKNGQKSTAAGGK